MTENTAPLPAGEEPAKPEMSDVDKLPTAMLAPNTPDEATQALATDTTIDEFSTLTMATPEIDATTLAAAAPVYNQFSAPTEAVAPAAYPGPQPQPGDPTVYTATPYGAQPGQPLAAQGMYASYTAQPGMSYPGQPGMPIPAAKKRRPLLWVALVVVVLLLIGGGTAFAIVSHLPTNTPTQALQQFCDGMTTLNAQEVYTTFSAASKEKTSLAQVKQSFALLKDFNGTMKFSKCTVSDVQENGSTATGQVTLTTSVSLLGISTSDTSTMPMKLVLENNTWKIDFTQTNGSSNNGSINVPTFPPDFPTPTTSGN